MEKSAAEVLELCKRVAKQSQFYASKDRRTPRRQAGLLETDEATSLQAQIATLTKKLNNFETSMGVKAALSCGVCQGDQHTDMCSALNEVNYVGNFGRQGQGFQNQGFQGQRQWNQQSGGSTWGQSSGSNPPILR